MDMFRTHNGDIIKGAELQTALDTVADDWHELAHAVYKENAYADHVTEKTKLDNLQRGIETAARIKLGEETGFWLWQRVNTVLTGECIAMLP